MGIEVQYLYRSEYLNRVQNTECGIMLEGFNGFQEGDTLQCYTIISRPQTAEDVANLQLASK